MELLRKHREKQEKEKQDHVSFYHDHGLVIQTHIGTPVNPRNLSRSYYSLLNKIQNSKNEKDEHKYPNFPKIRFHDLRHTHATMLLMRGVHPKIVQERLGHSSISITLDTYSHVIPGLQEAALKSLGGLLSNE
ncbi:site-specific tyrosine recombinase XerC [compost metagenome]